MELFMMYLVGGIALGLIGSGFALANGGPAMRAAAVAAFAALAAAAAAAFGFGGSEEEEPPTKPGFGSVLTSPEGFGFAVEM